MILLVMIPGVTSVMLGVDDVSSKLRQMALSPLAVEHDDSEENLRLTGSLPIPHLIK